MSDKSRVLYDNINFVEFMKKFDDWNSTIVVNDNDLNPIVEGTISDIMYDEVHAHLFRKEVVSFGFYEGSLVVRVK